MFSETEITNPTRTPHISQTELPVPNEFSFHECLRFLARSDKERMHIVQNNGVRKFIKVNGTPVLFDVRNGRPGFLQINFMNRAVRAATRSALISLLRTILDCG